MSEVRIQIIRLNKTSENTNSQFFVVVVVFRRTQPGAAGWPLVFRMNSWRRRCYVSKFGYFYAGSCNFLPFRTLVM